MIDSVRFTSIICCPIGRLCKTNRNKLISKLRVKSRRKYLEKRKKEKLAEMELEADILDNKYLFDENILTQRKKERKNSQKKQLLHLAKEHEKAR